MALCRASLLILFVGVLLLNLMAVGLKLNAIKLRNKRERANGYSG